MLVLRKRILLRGFVHYALDALTGRTRIFGKGATVNSFCYAKDERNQYRRQHKPVAGKYEYLPRLSCAWCGKWLEPAGMIQ